jgi:hypothetical protein
MKAGLIRDCEEVNGEKWTDLFKSELKDPFIY